MKIPRDHDIRVWLDAATYLAVRHESDDDGRSLSEWVRHLIVMRLRQLSVAAHADASGGPGSVRDGDSE